MEGVQEKTIGSKKEGNNLYIQERKKKKNTVSRKNNFQVFNFNSKLF